ncbi:MAG: translation initiation factor eIF-2B [Candidatus Odinarchaeia archaeon]
MKIINEVADKIRSLKIQGATNIAMSALKAVSDQIEILSPTNIEDSLKFLSEIREILFQSRPTEPAMRNGIRFLIYNLRNTKNLDKPVKDLIKSLADEYIRILRSAKERISIIGSNRISSDMTILTHCHSSVVTNILIKAFKSGKKFDVICTETRPLFQGHITANELVENGIKTTLIVDSAMRWAIQQKEVDLILVGADAITSEGVVINKIGTRLLALAAHEYNIPFYVASPILKFDPETIIGKLEKIEMRSPIEVWGDPPANLIIENPAFETVSRNYIDGLMTEIGVIPPSHLYCAAHEKYPFIFEE